MEALQLGTAIKVNKQQNKLFQNRNSTAQQPALRNFLILVLLSPLVPLQFAERLYPESNLPPEVFREEREGLIVPPRGTETHQLDGKNGRKAGLTLIVLPYLQLAS